MKGCVMSTCLDGTGGGGGATGTPPRWVPRTSRIGWVEDVDEGGYDVILLGFDGRWLYEGSISQRAC